MIWEYIHWVPRHLPLVPEAAFVSGAASLILAQHILSMEADSRKHLRGVCGKGFLIVLGPDSALPWCEGIRYLGRPMLASPLLWPTEVEPNCSESLLARAISEHGRKSENSGPFALIPEQRRLFSLAAASAIENKRLEHWLTQA